MREVFQRVGVDMPDQVFQEVWQEAERRDPRGEVCMPYYSGTYTWTRFNQAICLLSSDAY